MASTPQAGDYLGNGRFRLLRRLGSGGMGVVYEAQDRDRNARVALKTLRHGDADTLYRLKREFRGLAEFHHPNLVALHELIVDEQPFITMELVEGEDLLDAIRLRGGGDFGDEHTDSGLATADTMGPTIRAYDESLVRRLLPQLAQGLMALHEAGQIHRDIKPSNIKVTAAERLVILDFGLVANVDRTEPDSMTGQVVGTVGYMAPEQCRGDSRITPAADWYAVGSVLYEILTGRPPFTGPTMRVLIDKQQFDPAPPRALKPNVPRDLDGLVVDLLRREPASRPDGAQFLRRLGVETQSAPTYQASIATSFVSCVGRERELGALERGMERLADLKTSITIVSSPSGIGKTTLIRSFLERHRLQMPRLVVLQGRCNERETVPYQAIDSMVDHLSAFWSRLSDADAREFVPLDAALLPRLFPVLGRVQSLITAPRQRVINDPLELRARGFDAFREVLYRISQRHPLVVFLDDMQWVDASTLNLLAELLRPPDPPALYLILATRPEGVPALLACTDKLGLQTEQLTLGPLAPESARELARRLLRENESQELAARVAAEAQGNPLFIGELAQFIQSTGHSTLGPLRLEDALAQRLASLSEGARQVMELVALAGMPVSRRVLEVSSRLTSSDVGREIGILRTTHFLRAAGARSQEQVEPYHDRVRNAVLAGIPADTKQARSLQLALAFEETREAGADQLAVLWRAAGDNPRAAAHAVAAAEEAATRVDFDHASHMYRTALELGTFDGPRRRALTIALGDALSKAGRQQEAASTYMEVAAESDQTTSIELRRRSAEALLFGGYQEEGLKQIAAVLQTIGLKLSRSPWTSLMWLIVFRAWRRIVGLRWRERELGQIAPQVLSEADLCWSVAAGLSTADTIRGAEYQARHLRLVLRAGEPERISRALAVEAAHLGTQGLVRRSHDVLAVARSIAERVGSPYLSAYVSWADGIILFQAENAFRRSLERLNDAEDLFRKHLQSAGWEISRGHVFACQNLIYLGEFAQLARRLPGHVAQAEVRGDRYAVVTLRLRCNILWLARNDIPGAEQDLVDAIASWPPASRSFQVQHLYALCATCELELYRGRPDEAALHWARKEPLLKKSLLRRIAGSRAIADLVHARILVALAATTPADKALQKRALRVARSLRKNPLPIAHAWSHLIEAGIANVRGDRIRAESALRTAIDATRRLEARLWEAAARRRLGGLIGGAEGAAMIAEADAFMASQGIQSPARMTAMLVPGWPPAA